jgi:tRNA nucleotidyltransferase/poly(A) polymerase
VSPRDRRRVAARLAGLLRRDRLAGELARAAREAGVPVWLVGGVVRDAALGRPAGDLDAVAGPGTPALVRGLEQRLGHRAFCFRKRGITTWRLAPPGRRIDIVDLGRRSLRADLLRRELTINALAYDPTRGEILDPLGGLADLRAGRLRLPRPGVLRSDPLRALRLTRFLALLPGARLDRAARAEARTVAPRLGRIAVERVTEELERILGGPAPHAALAAAEGLGLLGHALPELIALRTCLAGRDRPDVWRHTLAALASATRPVRLPVERLAPDARLVLRWSLLLHDIAKPETLARRPDGTPTFHGHEVLGARRTRALLRRLRLPKEPRRRIERLVLLHLRPGHLAEAGAPPRGLRRLVRDAGDDLSLLVLHAAHDARGSGGPDPARRYRRLRRVLLALLRLAAERRARPLPRLIDGRDVVAATGLAPGPEVGRILRGVREAQEDGAVLDRAAALELARRLAASSTMPGRPARQAPEQGDP